MFITSAILCWYWHENKNPLFRHKETHLSRKIISKGCLFAFPWEELHILQKWTSNMFWFSTAMKWLSWYYFSVCLVNKIKIFWLSITIKWKLLLSESELTASDLELWCALGKWHNMGWIQIHSLQSLFGEKSVFSALVRLHSSLPCSAECLQETPGLQKQLSLFPCLDVARASLESSQSGEVGVQGGFSQQRKNVGFTGVWSCWICARHPSRIIVRVLAGLEMCQQILTEIKGWNSNLYLIFTPEQWKNNSL